MNENACNVEIDKIFIFQINIKHIMAHWDHSWVNQMERDYLLWDRQYQILIVFVLRWASPAGYSSVKLIFGINEKCTNKAAHITLPMAPVTLAPVKFSSNLKIISLVENEN